MHHYSWAYRPTTVWPGSMTDTLFLSLQTPNCMVTLPDRYIIIPEPTDPQLCGHAVWQIHHYSWAYIPTTVWPGSTTDTSLFLNLQTHNCVARLYDRHIIPEPTYPQLCGQAVWQTHHYFWAYRPLTIWSVCITNTSLVSLHLSTHATLIQVAHVPHLWLKSLKWDWLIQDSETIISSSPAMPMIDSVTINCDCRSKNSMALGMLIFE